MIEADIPGMAASGPCIRAGEFLFPSGLMAIGRDGSVRWKRRVIGLPRSGACRVQPGRGGLRLCRGAVPGRRDGNGPSVARPVFRLRHRGFSGIAMAWSARYGTQPHPFVCGPDADVAAGAGRRDRRSDRRFLDFDGFLTRTPGSRRGHRSRGRAKGGAWQISYRHGRFLGYKRIASRGQPARIRKRHNKPSAPIGG